MARPLKPKRRERIVKRIRKYVPEATSILMRSEDCKTEITCPDVPGLSCEKWKRRLQKRLGEMFTVRYTCRLFQIRPMPGKRLVAIMEPNFTKFKKTQV